MGELRKRRRAWDVRGGSNTKGHGIRALIAFNKPNNSDLIRGSSGSGYKRKDGERVYVRMSAATYAFSVRNKKQKKSRYGKMESRRTIESNKKEDARRAKKTGERG